SPQERARRRLLELEKRGQSASYEEILNGIIQRDKIDSTREHAPLKAAADAYIVNTDGKTVEQVVQECLQITGLKPIN
ncbi:MAG TPA: (d)CMP kinase, partial [Anaerolineaceae bacterium]|nr:(d)CMP kinase [Anaerolineaceae bacterium]